MFGCYVCLKAGKGTNVDVDEAWRYLNKSVSVGNCFAMHYLACAYFEGEGVTQNYNLAFKLFSDAANGGCFFSYEYMGICYEAGLGVGKNDAKAIMWFEKASKFPLKDQDAIIKHLEILKKQLYD